MLKIPVTSKDHIQGSASAPILLVEYGDYQCPYCGAAYPVVKRVQQHFGDKLSLVFRNFPLNEMHPEAEIAAETAEFAGDHDKFWQMHDAIYENQESLGPDMLLSLADELQLSSADLRNALEGENYKPRVREDFTGGVRSGVNGTPTFFINGHRHDGSPDFHGLVAAIQAQLDSGSA